MAYAGGWLGSLKPKRVACLLAAVWLTAADVALAQEWRASAGGVELVDAEGKVVATLPLNGSPIYDILRIGNTLIVARGEAGVQAFDVADPPHPVPLYTLGGPGGAGGLAAGASAVKLVQNGSTLVVVIADYSAAAFDISGGGAPVPTRIERALAPVAPVAPVAPPAGVAPPPPPIDFAATPIAANPAPAAQPPAAPARVTSLRDGWIYVESDAPISKGQRYVILSQALTTVPDPTSGTVTSVPSNLPSGMIEISQVAGSTGAARLPKGTVATPGDLAQPTTLPMVEEVYFPEQWRDMTRLAVDVRPFIPVGSLGLGVIASMSVEHYFSFPLKLGVQLSPLGILAVSDGTGVTGEFHGRVGYAHDWFEIELLPGVEFHRYGDPTRFSLAYGVRMGALDGVNFRFQNAYRVNKIEDTKEFAFASATGGLDIPLHRRFTLTAELGGSSTWAWGAGGVKSYLRGSGGPDTLILRTAIGGAWIRDREAVDSNVNVFTQGRGVEQAGPSVNVGLDARF